jgi:hypothetical protein
MRRVINLLVCEHSRFWVSGASTCELQVCDIEGTYYTVENIKEVVGYRERLIHDKFVSEEAR